jgi:hypothetical protein
MTTDTTWINDTGTWYSFGTWAPVATIGGCFTTNITYPEPKPTRRRKTMNVYLILLIDALENEVLKQEAVIGRTDSDASAAFNLTPAEAKAVSKGTMAIVISRLGEYEPKEVALVKEV